MGCSAGLPSISSKEISLGPWRPEEHWVECYYEGREEEYEESKNAALTFWAFVMNVILVLVSRAGYGWGLNSLAIVANKSNNNINETTQQRAMRRGTTNSNNNNQDEPMDAGMRPSNFDWLTVENGAWTQGLLSWPGLAWRWSIEERGLCTSEPHLFVLLFLSRHVTHTRFLHSRVGSCGGHLNGRRICWSFTYAEDHSVWVLCFDWISGKE